MLKFAVNYLQFECAHLFENTFMTYSLPQQAVRQTAFIVN